MTTHSQKTPAPFALAECGEGDLISRSQARRVLLRFDRFSEVLLDFDGVESIGQAFADEIFRVFRRENPKIKLGWTRANPIVERMIRRACAHLGDDLKDQPQRSDAAASESSPDFESE